jgi:MerR family transcriptional regulator/heat shock protein HspR
MADRAGRSGPAGPDASRPVYIISVAAELVSVHPRTLRIYEGEGLVCPARTRTNIRLYSENDLRRVLWIRHLTQNLGVNLAGVRVLFELEERLGMRLLEQLYRERHAAGGDDDRQPRQGSAGAADGLAGDKPSEQPSNPGRTAKEI